MEENETDIIIGDEIENSFAAKLKQLVEKKPDSDIVRFIDESKEARISELNSQMEQLGKDWVKRKISRISWGKSENDLRNKWNDLESSLRDYDVETRFGFFGKLATGLRLMVKRPDKDQLDYAYSVMRAINLDPSRPFIRPICDVYPITFASIIFLKCVTDLWNNSERSINFKNYMLEPENNSNLVDSKEIVQVGNVMYLLSNFYGVEKRLPK